MLTYNPKTRRLYIHVLVWPSAGRLYLEGYAGKIEYAQLLNDASEVRFREIEKDIEEEGLKKGDVVLYLPIKKPPVEIPVVELFLK